MLRSIFRDEEGFVLTPEFMFVAALTLIVIAIGLGTLQSSMVSDFQDTDTPLANDRTERSNPDQSTNTRPNRSRSSNDEEEQPTGMLICGSGEVPSS